MLMYWIASKHQIFGLIANGLGIEKKRVYWRLYGQYNPFDDFNMKIADEINRILKKNIDLITMVKLYDKEEAEIILSKI